MVTRMQKYGLDKYYGGSEPVRPGEAEKRIQLLAVAGEDFAKQNGRTAPLVDLLAWLKEDVPEAQRADNE